MRKDIDKGEVSRRNFLIDAGLALGGPAFVAAMLPAAFASGAGETRSTAPAPPKKVVLELVNPMGVIDPPPTL